MTEPIEPGLPRESGLSRRALFGLAGVGVVGAGAAAAVAAATTEAVHAGVGAALDPSTVYPFYGRTQAGIVTPAQDRLHFAAFDVADIGRDGLIGLLRDWTAASARMTAGQPTGTAGASYDAPPDDTGEALDLPAAGLTITFGFGPGLFDDRFGLADRRPSALTDLPPFPGEALVEQQVGGDLCIQACSDDPQVAVHAIRNLSRIAFGRASLRWSQLGYGRTSSTTRAQTTPRNLFGFKDGTSNIRAEETAELDKHVWADDGWMSGGTYLVARKIRMTVETWDRASLREQERVVGRAKADGAPLSGGGEFTKPDFAASDARSGQLIDAKSHVRLAHPDLNDGIRILRRGYNFVDGNDELGRLNAGLFFISFQRDPAGQFVPLQLALARNDAMNEYLKHVGSGVFAIPPGAREGSYVGAGLFA